MGTTTAKVNPVTVKKVIFQGSQILPYYGYEILISFRKGTNKVIGVEIPDGAILNFTYTSASATSSIITVNDFTLDFLPAGNTSSFPIDASGDYTIF